MKLNHVEVQSLILNQIEYHQAMNVPTASAVWMAASYQVTNVSDQVTNQVWNQAVAIMSQVEDQVSKSL
jgi:hypothetical protein